MGRTTSEEREKLRKAAARAGPVARLDLAVIEAVEPWADNPAVEALGKASELADQPPLVTASALTLAAGLLGRKPRLARTGARMLAAHGLATLIKALVKNHVDRTRPREVEKNGKHEAKPGRSSAKEKRSFPSGHSAGAVAVARAVTRDNPSAAAIAYPLAATAAAIQVPRKAHFPSDVIVGAAIGLLAEALVAAAFAKLVRLKDDARA
jgi:membrane-associated phospholipid phosphatase